MNTKKEQYLKSQGNPQISVVMPTYNQSNYLEKAIQSVLDQTWTDYEFIIVNDGSTDSTKEILDSYQQKHPHLIIIHQDNKKLPEALNTGFRGANGKYLTWTSSDNIMKREMLSLLNDALNKNPDISMVYSDWELIDENDQVIKKCVTYDYDKYLLMRLNYINCCFLYRRECQETVGLYDDTYRYAEDWEYWLRISKKFKLKHIYGCLYQFRVHKKSLTNAVVKDQSIVKPGEILLQKKLKSNKLAWFWSKIYFELFKLRYKETPGSRFYYELG
jgi:glycosyltransferase involved in cell wall biosynthesis